jgi:hypothetical protein
MYDTLLMLHKMYEQQNNNYVHTKDTQTMNDTGSTSPCDLVDSTCRCCCCFFAQCVRAQQPLHVDVAETGLLHA